MILFFTLPTYYQKIKQLKFVKKVDEKIINLHCSFLDVHVQIAQNGSATLADAVALARVADVDCRLATARILRRNDILISWKWRLR